MSQLRGGQRALLLRVARRALLERGLEPDPPPEAVAEADRLSSPGPPWDGATDLRGAVWCSIDNDDSRDLDQLSVAEERPDGRVRVLVAVADVSALVASDSAVDRHAATNTTSIYTPPRMFPMLPERLSTDLTSLNPDEDRLAVVVAWTVGPDGRISDPSVERAVVRNHAKLAYPSVGAWLEEAGPMPGRVGEVPDLDRNLRIQDRAAQLLLSRREEEGTLELASLEVRARIENDEVVGLARDERGRARDLIENFMITANGVVARFLEAKRFPVLRRVVRTPARWPRIVEIAEDLDFRLPSDPDPKALQEFLVARHAADPLRFPDLSLLVVKLLGRGEYVATGAGDERIGHFGLAVSDYAHSTAPNRRYPDLLTQRLVKAALAGESVPYAPSDLRSLAAHCTHREDDVQKVERLMRKAAAACFLSRRIGDEFDGVVTGASPKGTYARIFEPPAEGRIERGTEGLDVGDRVRLRLVHTDAEKGWIDFHRVGHRPVGRHRAR